MTELLFTVNAVVPLFLIVFIGVLLRRFLHIKKEAASIVNRICYYVLIPCSLFSSAYRCDFSQIGNAWPYVFAAASYLIAVPILMWVSGKITPDRKKAGAFCNSAFRPNCVLLGIPLAISILGETNAFPAVLLTMLLTPLFNALGVFVLTYYAQNGERVNLPLLLKSIVTPPLILSLLLGFLCNALHMRLPSLLAAPISSLSAAATPLAMLSIGLSFEFVNMREDKKLVLTASAIKIVLLPLVFTLAAVALGFRENVLFAIYLIHAVPSAANSGVITDSMGCDGTLAGEVVLTTTLASVFTLVGGILLLQHLSLV